MQQKINTTEVFTPGHYPAYTYVERAGENLEQRLQDALATPGEIVSVSGPSKSGKTVLVERVVGLDNLITVTGAGIQSADMLWDRVLDWMESPVSITSTSSSSSATGGSVEVEADAKIPLVGKVKGSGAAHHDRERGKSESQEQRRQGMAQVIREISDSSYVVLIDDYHYMPRNVQTDVAQQIKEAARQRVKICTASVPHRADDVVRGNPELRGRVRAIDVGYWDPSELRKIPEEGFRLLNASLPDSAVRRLLNETSGSPQLMQAACLQVCFDFGLRKTADVHLELNPNNERLDLILGETASRTDFSSLVRDMHGGPKTRGTERKEFDLIDGSRGDVYRAVLLALANDPAILSFSYNELFNRIQRVCSGNETPQAASVYQACNQISKMAEDRSPTERIIEWDDNSSILAIVDPYFLFFIRWSNRLEQLGAKRV